MGTGHPLQGTAGGGRQFACCVRCARPGVPCDSKQLRHMHAQQRCRFMIA